MASRSLCLTLAVAGLAAFTGSALGQLLQPATLKNGGFETPEPHFGVSAQGWRNFNYAAWRVIGDGKTPATQVHAGTHSHLLPGGQGRPNGEFEAVQAEDLLDLDPNKAWNFTSPPNSPDYNPRNWPPYEITFTEGTPNTVSMAPLKVGFWFMIPANDPVVVSKFGLKLGILRNDPGDFGYFQTFEYQDMDPADPTTPTRYPGVVLTTATGPYGPTGQTINLPAMHTNGIWIHYVKTITAADVCTDFQSGGTCPTPPGPIDIPNMVYYGPVASMFAQRFDTPDVLPCGGIGEPACVRNRSYGALWVDDFSFLQCTADFNGSGSVTPQDLFDFLSAYFSHSPSADFNHSGSTTVQDIFDYLHAFFAGCS